MVEAMNPDVWICTLLSLALIAPALLDRRARTAAWDAIRRTLH